MTNIKFTKSECPLGTSVSLRKLEERVVLSLVLGGLPQMLFEEQQFRSCRTTLCTLHGIQIELSTFH
jgi:hypothetical protein